MNIKCHKNHPRRTFIFTCYLYLLNNAIIRNKSPLLNHHKHEPKHTLSIDCYYSPSKQHTPPLS